MIVYNPNDWYWVVLGNSTHVFSSAACAFVENRDSVFQAWLDSGNYPTQINSEEELRDVLAAQNPAGWPGLLLENQARIAIQESDITFIRFLEQGVPFPDEWKAYRAQLRDIIRSSRSFSELPVCPSFPVSF